MLLMTFPLGGMAKEDVCPVEDKVASVVAPLFAGSDHLYSVLWWEDPEGKLINARSFIINGLDSVPIFSSEAEGVRQLAGSGYEKELVGIDPGLLAAILQGAQYAILNPGGQEPVQFKTCALKPYVRVPGT
jgi:hypothetical protein